jgi:hypothetical protein
MVGVAIGATVPNPSIAVPLSLGLHFLGDAVPHWDFYSNTEREERLKGWRPIAVMADLILAVGVGLTATLFALWVLQDQTLALTIFLCGIASVLPDALEAPYIFMGKNIGFVGALTNIQRKMQFQAPLPWGIITQFVVMLVSALLFVSSTGL